MLVISLENESVPYVKAPLQKGSLEGTFCSVLWDTIKCGQNIGGLDDYQLCLNVLGPVGIKI